ncbi:MAG: hypothetical protein OXK80_02370 [Bdellovibrionales bacterium]|nr:hypothetical protein [Bdellovibrionales bacterium]
MIRFDELPIFQREFKKLKKRYRSLSEDLTEFQKVISVSPLGNKKHFSIIRKMDDLYVVKARFFCKYLKGSSLRIVYAYFPKDKKIQFIEVYFKGNKENEDAERIRKYLKNSI